MRKAQHLLYQVPLEMQGAQLQGEQDASLAWFTHFHPNHAMKNGAMPEWFHGVLSRNDAEHMLMCSQRGCFLIRFSQTRTGYTLSYRGEDCCRHFMVDVNSSGLYSISGENIYHRSLQDLVDFHRRVTIQPFNELLTCACVKVGSNQPVPLPRKTWSSTYCHQGNAEAPVQPLESLVPEGGEETNTGNSSSIRQTPVSNQPRHKTKIKLINFMKKSNMKKCASEEHINVEISQESGKVPDQTPFAALERNAGGQTCAENVYEELPGAWLLDDLSSAFVQGPDLTTSSVEQQLPEEYLPPPPFAPGY